MRIALLALLTVLIAGCAETTTLVNDKGEKRYCYKDAHGAFSNIAATAQFNKCLNEAGAAGFKRVE